MRTKDIQKKYGKPTKSSIIHDTIKNPDMFRRFKDKMSRVSRPLSLETLQSVQGLPPVNWNSLINNLAQVKPGRDESGDYENVIEEIFTSLFYPHLQFPRKQTKIHGGKKIIDITYENSSKKGFFWWLGQHYKASIIPVECKNYTGEVGNPELDQMIGRFAPRRGKFGIIACRKFDDKARFAERCRDSAKDDQGYIVALDDADIVSLIRIAASPSPSDEFILLKEKFMDLIN